MRDGVVDADHGNPLDQALSRIRGRRPSVLVSIEGIVDAFGFLYRQPPRPRSFALDVRTFKEKWQAIAGSA